MTLRRRDDPEVSCRLGQPATKIIGVFNRVIVSNKSEALLVWPQRPDGVAVFHALAALGRIPEADRTGLATVFFPWSRNTGGTQRTLLVDRDTLCRSILPALNRAVAPGVPTCSAYGFLLGLHSLKHVFQSGKTDRRFRKALEDYPGLIHPSLYEITSQLGVRNDGIRPYNDQFLKRLRKHTWIGQQSKHIEAAADPLRAPFFLFGVHHEAVRIKLLRSAGMDAKHGGRRPDIILMDLTRKARNRVGKAWQQPVKRLLAAMLDMYGESAPPALAVTEDVFVLQALRWEVLKEYDLRRSAHSRQKAPTRSSVVLSSSPIPLDDEAIGTAPLGDFTAELYGGDLFKVVEFALRLRRALLDAGDEEIAEAVALAIDVLQNLIGLPGPPRQLHDFLADNYEGYEKLSLGARYDYLTPRGRIKSALKLGLGGANQKQLTEFLEAYDKLCAATATDSPGRKLFDQCVNGLVKKSTRSIVVFSSELLRGFAEWRVENDSALSQVKPALGRKLLLVDRREAIEELDLDERTQKQFQRIVFIEPFADDLLHVLTRSWLPDKVLVLANLARAEQTVRRIRILLEIEGIDPIRAKLAGVLEKLEAALEGRKIDILDVDAAPPVPRMGTLDLTTVGGPGSGQPRLIQTSGDLKVRAFDGSEFAVYDPEALQVFSRKLGKDLAVGDQVCVFSSDFVGMAREKLNLSANASEILPLYHAAIVDAAERLPGADMMAKAAALRDRMLKLNEQSMPPSVQAMRHWIDVADLVHAPRNEVRPQAPRERRHYLLFMEAMGISADLARHYWDWGIFWTRSLRIRTGAAFHQVFMGILIDPHGTASRLPAERRHEVWRIYETAEHHVVTVVSNEREAEQ